MTPALASKVAIRAWPFRLPAVALTLLAFGAVAATVFTDTFWSTQLAFTALGPVIGVSWSVLCIASWFHPEHGTLSPGSRFVGRLPAWMQSAVRWYASVCLLLFAFVCVIAWPAFSLSNLWRLVE